MEPPPAAVVERDISCTFTPDLLMPVSAPTVFAPSPAEAIEHTTEDGVPAKGAGHWPDATQIVPIDPV
jgi:hypothetical protein